MSAGDPPAMPEDVARFERGSFRSTWTPGSAYSYDHGGFGAVPGESPPSLEHVPNLERNLPQQDKGPAPASFGAFDVKRFIGIVRGIPSGLSLAIGQNTKARDFDYDREVMNSIVSDFHLDFETPHGESTL